MSTNNPSSICCNSIFTYPHPNSRLIQNNESIIWILCFHKTKMLLWRRKQNETTVIYSKLEDRIYIYIYIIIIIILNWLSKRLVTSNSSEITICHRISHIHDCTGGNNTRHQTVENITQKRHFIKLFLG